MMAGMDAWLLLMTFSSAKRLSLEWNQLQPERRELCGILTNRMKDRCTSVALKQVHQHKFVK